MARITPERLTRAVVVRLFFFVHAVLCTWRVVFELGNDVSYSSYWSLLIIPLLLLPECVLTLKYSKQGEWETFRPCIFIYLTSVVPNIWLLELKILQDRFTVEEMDGMNNSMCSTETDEDDGLGNIFEAPFDESLKRVIQFDSDSWSLALQQVLLFILVVGRWMLPRGGINHDKLSNILLLQIGMAADILEFLSEGLRTDEVLCEQSVIIGALVLWTVSLLQLPLHFDTKVVRRISLVAQTASSNRSTLNRLSKSEVWEILTVVFLQDGPFLCMRFYFLFYLGIFNQALVFFIAKNCLVLTLQLYRLWALMCIIEIDEHGKRSFRLSGRIRATLRGRRSADISRSSSRSMPRHDHTTDSNLNVVVDDDVPPNDGRENNGHEMDEFEQNGPNDDGYNAHNKPPNTSRNSTDHSSNL